MESWRKVWREGIAPLLSTASLEALRDALKSDDKRLIQGATCEPPPLACVADWEVQGACALSYAGWQGDGLQTVAEVEEFFVTVCHAIDQRIGEAAGCRYFLNWYDETTRTEMLRELLPEVQRAIRLRKSDVQETTEEFGRQEVGQADR